MEKENLKSFLTPYQQGLFPEYAKVLTEELSNDDVEWRVGSKKDGSILPYITARRVFDLLARSFGINHSIETRPIETSKGLSYQCTITIYYPAFTSIGEPTNMPPIVRTGNSDITDIEPIKGGESDAIKRAAVSIFPCIWALYKFPKIRCSKELTGEAMPAMWELEDTIDLVITAFGQGKIAPNGTVYISKENGSLVAKYKGRPIATTSATTTKPAATTTPVVNKPAPQAVDTSIKEKPLPQKKLHLKEDRLEYTDVASGIANDTYLYKMVYKDKAYYHLYFPSIGKFAKIWKDNDIKHFSEVLQIIDIK